jgi:hypothetical protein
LNDHRPAPVRATGGGETVQAGGATGTRWRGGIGRDIAGALASAGTRFGDPALIGEARRIATAVLDHETAEAGGRLVLVAGPWARERRIVNPSYLATCGGADLAAVTGDTRWQRVASDGVALVEDLVDGGGLPPDWAVLGDDGRLRPVAGPDDRRGPGRYGLDAARIPARLAACPGGREVAAGLWARIGSLDGEGAALAYSLDGRRLDEDRHPPRADRRGRRRSGGRRHGHGRPAVRACGRPRPRALHLLRRRLARPRRGGPRPGHRR